MDRENELSSYFTIYGNVNFSEVCAMKTRKFNIDGHEVTITELRLIILDLYVGTRKVLLRFTPQKKGTVNAHFSNLYGRLEQPSRLLLQRWAIRNKLDNKGFFRGENLFEGYKKLPW